MSHQPRRGPAEGDASSREGLALVTGASTGIGRELARVFAAHGFDLVVVARSADALEALAGELRADTGVAVRVVPRDLCAPGAVTGLAELVAREDLCVDVLVNNAGVLEMGAFTATAPERLDRILELNIRVLTAMTRSLLPGMVARGRGRILNVASVAGFQPVPSMAAYAASKAFVLSLGESLSEELAGKGVSVTTLCPGLTVTHMVDKVRAENARAAYIPEFLMSDAAEVARLGFEACMAGRAVEVPGLGNRVLTQWARFQPRWVVRTVGGLVGRRFL